VRGEAEAGDQEGEVSTMSLYGDREAMVARGNGKAV
jgi:hypothetical protein